MKKVLAGILILFCAAAQADDPQDLCCGYILEFPDAFRANLCRTSAGEIQIRAQRSGEAPEQYQTMVSDLITEYNGRSMCSIVINTDQQSLDSALDDMKGQLTSLNCNFNYNVQRVDRSGLATDGNDDDLVFTARPGSHENRGYATCR